VTSAGAAPRCRDHRAPSLTSNTGNAHARRRCNPVETDLDAHAKPQRTIPTGTSMRSTFAARAERSTRRSIRKRPPSLWITNPIRQERSIRSQPRVVSEKTRRGAITRLTAVPHLIWQRQPVFQLRPPCPASPRHSPPVARAIRCSSPGAQPTVTVAPSRTASGGAPAIRTRITCPPASPIASTLSP